MQVEGSYVFTSSALGVLQVFQLRDHALHLLYESDDAKLASGARALHRPIRCLAIANQKLYYGDDGMNLKVLDWKKGNLNNILIQQIYG